MIAGGTLNTRVLQNDLNQIQSGQYTTPMLLRLPLLRTFHQPSTTGTPYGGRPDLATTTGRNPVAGNAANGARINATRIALQQPTNCIQLIWHALDANGDYVCSYPINSPLNADGANSWPITYTAGLVRWAFGWIRLNGFGPWLPMSLFPSTYWAESFLGVLPFGGFASINGPMSFFDWIGYWDGVGDLTTGSIEASDNAFLLAVATANLSFSSNGETMGTVSNYATPSGSGTEPQPPNTDTIRSQDVLVRTGGNGR